MKNYEFNMKLQNRENLLNIYRTLEPLSSFSKYNDWLDREYMAMIVPDNYKEICLEDQKKLTKPYWTYKQKYYNWFGTKDEFDVMVIRQQEERRKLLERQSKRNVSQVCNGGVYGIYRNGQLIYIGSTVDFNKRWNEHKRNIKNHSNSLYVYKLLDEQRDSIEFKSIIRGEDLQCDRNITSTDLKTIEFALILLYKPCGNIAGRLQPFRYK